MVDLTDHCIVISGSLYGATKLHVFLCVTLCYSIDKLLSSELSVCYTVLCRITSGPFDQEVISSSLTLEDPDLKVRESTSLVLWLLV